MQGELAQLISLVSYGNAFLLHDYDLEGFYPGNSAFQYCNQIRFLSGPGNKDKEYAADPLVWLKRLADEGYICLRLECHLDSEKEPPQHTMVAFAGGGSWWMSACAEDRMDYWSSSWRVSDRDNPDRHIWGVTYHKVKGNLPVSQMDSIGIAAATETLDSALGEIAEFSERHSQLGWTDVFIKAQDILTGAKPPCVVRMGKWIPEEFYSVEARRLLSGSAQSWVFGGMGSWNDIWFEDKSVIDEYEALTGRLYDCVLTGLREGVNSMDRTYEQFRPF